MFLLLVLTFFIFIGLVVIIIFVDASAGLQEFIYVLSAMAGGSLITIIGSLVGKMKEKEEVAVRVVELRSRDREAVEELV